MMAYHIYLYSVLTNIHANVVRLTQRKTEKDKGQRKKDKGQRKKDKGSMFVLEQYRGKGGQLQNRKSTTGQDIHMMQGAKHA